MAILTNSANSRSDYLWKNLVNFKYHDISLLSIVIKEKVDLWMTWMKMMLTLATIIVRENKCNKDENDDHDHDDDEATCDEDLHALFIFAFTWNW